MKDLLAVMETMPDDGYSFRPAGAVKDVRTFGEIVYHIIYTNEFVCAMGDARVDTAASSKPVPALDRASLIPLVQRAKDRCTAWFASLTDAAMGQALTTRQAGRALRAIRGNAAIFAIAHSNEHYGNLVTYLRAKGLVPPVTPAQASWISPGKP